MASDRAHQLEFRWLARAEYGAWDRFAADSPQGSLYCTSAYLDAIGAPYRIGVAERRGVIWSGMACARNELGIYANPLFVKHLGVLHAAGVTGDTSRQYATERVLIAAMPRHAAWSYTFHPCYTNWLPFYWAGFQQTTRYTYVIDLAEGDFRRAYDEKVRAPLRAAARDGIRIAEITDTDLIRVNRLTYKRRHSRPPYSDQRLAGLLRAWRQIGCLRTAGAVDPQGRVHAVAAVVYDERSAHLVINGSDPDLRRSGANTLLVDHLIADAAQRSRCFDFEGSMHERIERFYRGFGGRATPYFQIARRNLATRMYHRMIAVIKALNG